MRGLLRRAPVGRAPSRSSKAARDFAFERARDNARRRADLNQRLKEARAALAAPPAQRAALERFYEEAAAEGGWGKRNGSTVGVGNHWAFTTSAVP